MSKLTQQQKEEIRQKIANGVRQKDIAKEYSVSTTIISRLALEYRAMRKMQPDSIDYVKLHVVMDLLECLKAVTKEDATESIAEKTLCLLREALHEQSKI